MMSTPVANSLPATPVTRSAAGLWVWVIITVSLTAAGVVILGFLWLAALTDPGGSLLLAVFAWAGCIPAALLALNGVAIAVVAVVRDEPGILITAIASLLGHLPLLLTMIGTGLIGALF